MKMLLLASEFDFNEAWRTAFKTVLPDAELGDVGQFSPDEVEVALVYNPPSGILCRYTNLRAIITLSAGVDGLFSDDSLPDVPLVRLAGDEMISLMREYVVYQVLRIHRNFAAIEQLNRDKVWKWLPNFAPASNRRVSVLGLGKLGYPCSIALSQLGFNVSGWSNSVKKIPGISCYWGAEGLSSMLSETDILVCLLPLTKLTRNILSLALFEQLPKGASVINVSRGACLNEEDLLISLNNGNISHATLDVFNMEPLPASHPFWTHPNITITPHVAADARPWPSVREIANTIRKLYCGQQLTNAVNRERGY